MTRSEFKELCSSKLVILDGATGTEMIKRGMPQGVSPELWAFENFAAVADIHDRYIDAGSDIVYVPSFGANRLKLDEFGLGGRSREINRGLAERSKANAAGRARVFGDLAPTGNFLEPYGLLSLEEAIAVYKEQVEALLEGGVDGFVIETMMDLAETRAALIAVRESCDLPAMVSMTFDASMFTLTGNDPVAALITLQALGADAFGCNCSTGPGDMAKLIARIKPHATVPLIAKPNAGVPKLVGAETVFSMNPAEFAEHLPALVAAGANILGGCCGTTPEHIAEVAKGARAMTGIAPRLEAVAAVSSARRTCFWGGDNPFVLIGERINPTGKKALQAELRSGSLDLVGDFAREQTQAGASILDVNLGCGGIDEKAMMERAVDEIVMASDLPLCIDSTDPEVVEAALRRYPGRALVNSVSGERDRIERMLPVAARYGAMFILLPLTDEGIPATANERASVVREVFAAAQKLGFHREDIVVDALIMTVSADQPAALTSLDLIDWAVRDFGVNTVCGLSNVSFGMPERERLNLAFLGMALGRGLSGAIANPASDAVTGMVRAGDVLTCRDPKMRRYVAAYSGEKEPNPVPATPLGKVIRCVLDGDETGIAPAVDAALAAGCSLGEVVDDGLIGAINRVGELFEARRYFLPQLVMSADAMRAGFAHLEPLLAESREIQAAPEKVLLATVEGDIHDIGKNIVALMLRNYGFEVIDLGKDVPASRIVAAVRETGARRLGLSALMTTTMPRMREVMDALAAAGLGEVRVAVGGAVVDRAFAESIGAEYVEDAMASVHWARSC